MCCSAGRAGTQPDYTPGRRRTVYPACAVNRHDRLEPTDVPTQERYSMDALHINCLTNGHNHDAPCSIVTAEQK